MGEGVFASYFDFVRVVNLPDRVDRRRQVLLELERAGLRPTPHRVELFKALRPPDAGGFPSIGARGCFLSHLALLQQAVAAGAQRILVMEDDLALDGAFEERGRRVIEAMEREPWDLVMLGHVDPTGQEDAATGATHGAAGGRAMVEIGAERELQCTHFYAVNGASVRRLVEFLNEMLLRPAGHPDGGPMHLDGAFNTYRRRGGDVKAWMAVPALGYQRASRSDVAAVGWFDRTPMVRGVVGAMRRMMERPRTRLGARP